MMSQAEIWRMQEYCESRNSERQERKMVSIWNILFLIAGVILATLSVCLVVYVMKLGIAMTGAVFCATGVAGTLGGIALIMMAKMNL